MYHSTVPSLYSAEYFFLAKAVIVPVHKPKPANFFSMVAPIINLTGSALNFLRLAAVAEEDDDEEEEEEALRVLNLDIPRGQERVDWFCFCQSLVRCFKKFKSREISATPAEKKIHSFDSFMPAVRIFQDFQLFENLHLFTPVENIDDCSTPVELNIIEIHLLHLLKNCNKNFLPAENTRS